MVNATIQVSRSRIFTDAGLLARQIDGRHKVKGADLKVLPNRAGTLIAQFNVFRIDHVQCEYNRKFPVTLEKSN